VHDQAQRANGGHASRPASDAVSEPSNIHQLLQGYIRDLAGADTTAGVVAALSAFGGTFGMPHVYIFESRIDGSAPHREVGRSAAMPQPIVDAILASPLLAWAIEAQTSVFVSETAEMLAVRGQTRTPALAGIEGLFLTLRVGPGHAHNYAFAGEHGIANSLSRSALDFAAQLAHERMSKAAWPVQPRVSLTPQKRKVLDLAMAGLTDAGIAKALGLATRTVRFHLANMERAFGVSTRGALIAQAAQRREETHP
jgi:DNA-binding CsgD family transcriptional regulator